MMSRLCSKLLRQLTKVAGANGHQDLAVVAGSAGICVGDKRREESVGDLPR